MNLSRYEALKRYCMLIQERLDDPIRETMRSITEVHHIIPRCVCGWKKIIESKHNLIRLYAHEHFLAHYYLSIIFPYNVGVQQAFYLMSNIKGRKSFQHIERFAYAYETAKAKVLLNRKNKTYSQLYGNKTANEIKIKQKKSKFKAHKHIIILDK